MYGIISEQVEKLDTRLAKVDEKVYTRVEGLRELVDEYTQWRDLIPDSDTEETIRIEVLPGDFREYSESDMRQIATLKCLYDVAEVLEEIGL